MYDATIEFASFLEFDNELRERFEGNVTPFYPTQRRAFEDLVRTAAPWIRRFPTACALDDETGAFLLRRDLYEPSHTVLEGAENAALISTEDKDLLRALLSAIERAGFPAQKAGTRGIQSTKSLIFKAVAVVAAFYTGSVSSDFSTHSKLVQNAGKFLANQEAQFLQIMGDAPADLRFAMSSLFDEIRHGDGGNESTLNAGQYAILESWSGKEEKNKSVSVTG